MVNNSTIMASVWLNSSNDFQQRIPNPTIAGMDATIKELFNPLNGDLFNQFVSTLINRIGLVRVKQQSFNNPLAVFKGEQMYYGSTIQEIAVQWIKAHAYDDESGEELLKLERPEAQQWFHSQNRRDKYAISLVYEELQRAFDQEYGLNTFVNAVMDTPRNSDEYDEYRIFLQLIAYYDANWGFFKHATATLPIDEASSKMFLQSLRTYAGMLQFPSARYNAADITVPVFAKPNELVLITTPAVQASIDVQALASLFNVEYADVRYRTVLVDEFPVPDMYALLTTEDFFVCHDTVYRNGSFWNEDNLSQKFYLHHWGVYSVSPFVPAIAFVVGNAGTTTPVVTQNVTGLNLTATETTIKPGGTLPLTVKLTGTLTSSDGDVPSTLKVAPDAATYTLAAMNGDAAIQLNSATYVDEYGVLHLQKSKIESGTVITVTATASYINPSGATTPHTATLDITVAS